MPYYVQFINVNFTPMKLLQVFCWGIEIIHKNYWVWFNLFEWSSIAGKPVAASYGRVSRWKLLGRCMRELSGVIALFYIYIVFWLTTALVKTHPLINLRFVGFIYFHFSFQKERKEVANSSLWQTSWSVYWFYDDVCNLLWVTLKF